jgi:hypothetical protein
MQRLDGFGPQIRMILDKGIGERDRQVEQSTRTQNRRAVTQVSWARDVGQRRTEPRDPLQAFCVASTRQQSGHPIEIVLRAQLIERGLIEPKIDHGRVDSGHESAQPRDEDGTLLAPNTQAPLEPAIYHML